MIALFLLTAISCPSHALTLAEAKARVLAAPNIKSSVRLRGARPFFESITRGANGWNFTVNARNACGGADPCSTLLGHYSVNRITGEVWDLDAGFEGRRISASRPLRLKKTC